VAAVRRLWIRRPRLAFFQHFCVRVKVKERVRIGVNVRVSVDILARKPALVLPGTPIGGACITDALTPPTPSRALLAQIELDETLPPTAVELVHHLRHRLQVHSLDGTNTVSKLWVQEHL